MLNLASIMRLRPAPSCFAGFTNIPYLLNCLINGILPSTALESGDQRPSHLSFLSFFAENYHNHKSPDRGSRPVTNGAIIRSSITNKTFSVETNELIDYI